MTLPRIAIVLCLAAIHASAGSVTYILSTTASGSIDGTSFSNSVVTITAIADTSSPGFPFSSTLTEGALSATFNTKSPYFFVNPVCSGAGGQPCVGFGDQLGDMFDLGGPALTGYVLGTASLQRTGTPFNLVNLAFTDDTGGTVRLSGPATTGTFTATVSNTPEPSTGMVTLLGALAIGLFVTVRRRTAPSL